jgi:hypothetical protein
MSIIHQRSILAVEQLGWLFIDDLLGSGTYEFMLPWQLSQQSWFLDRNSVALPDSVRVKIVSDKGMPEYILEQGNEKYPAGWQSLYYGQKDPSPAFIARGTFDMPLRFMTGVSLQSEWDDFNYQDNVVTWLDKNACSVAQAVLEPLTVEKLPLLKQLSIAGKTIHLS